MNIQQLKYNIVSPYVRKNINPVKKEQVDNSRSYATSVYGSKNISPIYFQSGIIKKPVEPSYTPISNARPITRMYDGDYSDIDKFSEFYAEKLNSSFLIPTNEDVENLISRIQKSTEASRETVLNVLGELTQYSNYNALDDIEFTATINDIRDFGIDYFLNFGYTADHSSNAVMSYLATKKAQMTIGDRNRGVILDDTVLSKFEELKTSTKSCEKDHFRHLSEEIKNKNILFLEIPAWDVKCSDGKYRSANMLIGSGFLEYVATDTINRMKKGEKLDDIIYSDFRERLEKIFSNEKDDLQVINMAKANETPTVDSIRENISPKKLDAQEVKKTIEKYVSTRDIRYSKKEIIEAVSKYLDVTSLAFSTDSLVLALKNLYKHISMYAKNDTYNKDEISYMITSSGKSFSLIAYMYMKINDIDARNIDGDFTLENIKNGRSKENLKVLIDDMSASGVTKSYATHYIKRQYETDRNKTYPPIYYASVVDNMSLGKSTMLINRLANPDRTMSEVKINDFGSFLFCVDEALDTKNPKEKDFKLRSLETLRRTYLPNFKLKDLYILRDILYRGYMDMALSCAFPYMIPDNNSDISSLVLGKLLHRNNAQANLFLSSDAYLEHTSTYNAILNEKV